MLQSLEARLASLPPRLPAGDAQQLLYQCAFAAGQAAGQRANSRAVQRWMIAASLLVLLCGGLAYRAASLAHPSLGKSEHIHHAAASPSMFAQRLDRRPGTKSIRASSPSRPRRTVSLISTGRILAVGRGSGQAAGWIPIDLR